MEKMNDHHQQPPSPGVRPIKAKDCIEELLKFTLSSSIDGTLGLDVGLSKDYCSKLLNDDDGPEINPTPNASDIAEGVPTYPLYKRLASTLYQSLSFGAFSRPYDRMPLMHEDSSLKHKEVAWIALAMEKGSELINVLENVDFELHVQEPFFSQLKDGMKTVEGRCAVGDYNSLHQKIKFIIGTKLITIFAEEDFTIYESPTIPVIESVEPSSFQAFECMMGLWGSGLSLGREMVFQVRRMENSFGTIFPLFNCDFFLGFRIFSGALILFNKFLVLQVQDVRRYASFSEMLEAESLTKVLPGVQTIEEGVQIYRKFYSEEKEKLNGVLAIGVTKPAAQPFISLAGMLSGLSYGGLQRLLGFVHTVGTTVEALPPPRSTLLSSFMLPHNPNVKGSTLTDGARALAKHVDRSGSKYWGPFNGSDPTKNRLAKDAISHLMAHCCWQNMHVVPPHGVVYEIRTADGYGARWSEDGNEFIGFLEPYMEDGHSNRWKH
ncbi:hypothetical protein RHMOL_Rhmol09G0023600 [Rhododendron molle]|uniref:Uncharacterized protein n=1 Tax=Rhododendron molle TaxID=49168 RepID=A0ACC0M9J5_RHOML|nr:hypothetical protein RHMOL_Rhmol09G0023600 [Rhododendron molle]